jgi:hypothetical protein
MCHRFSRELRSSERRILASLACAGAMVLGMPTTAAAQEAPNLLTDDWQFSLGTFLINSEPTVTLDGETQTGSDVDFDDALGGGDATRVRLDGSWRMTDSGRHKLRMFAFSMNRDNTRKFDDDITWGDGTFPADVDVKAEFEFSIIQLAYEYEFLQRDNYEVGASFGLHYTSLEASLSGQATVGENTTPVDYKNDASVDLPLPVFGLHGLWRLPQNFWIAASAQYFALSIDEYDGSVTDYRVLLNWQPSKWLGVGLGYDVFEVDVDVEKDKFNGSLNLKYDGPMLFYSIAF